MWVWIAGCLEDQTAGMKGDGEKGGLKENVGSVASLCVYGVKKAGVSMGTLSVFLYVTGCTEHTDCCTLHVNTARFPLEIKELFPPFLIFLFPIPLCLSTALSCSIFKIHFRYFSPESEMQK